MTYLAHSRNLVKIRDRLRAAMYDGRHPWPDYLKLMNEVARLGEEIKNIRKMPYGHWLREIPEQTIEIKSNARNQTEDQTKSLLCA